MTLRVTCTIDAENILAARGLGSSLEAQRALAEAAATLAEPYTPRDTGALASPEVRDDGLAYGVPYAAYQYYGVSAAGKSLVYQNDTGQRGAYWIARMAESERERLLAAVQTRTGGRIR